VLFSVTPLLNLADSLPGPGPRYLENLGPDQDQQNFENPGSIRIGRSPDLADRGSLTLKAFRMLSRIDCEFGSLETSKIVFRYQHNQNLLKQYFCNVKMCHVDWRFCKLSFVRYSF